MSRQKIRFSYFTPGPNPREAADKGVGAEKLGIDCVWVSDHLTDMPPAKAVYDAWTILGNIGARTTTIRLGSGVTDIQRIHPAKVAGMIATLDHLTNGRVNLGIGAGEVMNTRLFGMRWEPPDVRVSRLKESLEVMKLLWGSSIDNPVSYSGEHYRLEDAHLTLLKDTTPLRYYQGSDSSTSHQRQRSPCFSRLTFLMFHPQPRYAPDPRFIHHRNGISVFQTSPRMSKLVADMPPNRVHYPTDHHFASGCSPPRLMATQLPSATWLVYHDTDFHRAD